MKIRRALLIYKRSPYTKYFQKYGQGKISGASKSVLNREMQRFQKAHQQHQQSIKLVESILQKYSVAYEKCHRECPADYSRYPLIITVGGDGTFLRAAREVKKQYVLGVNSAPCDSVGKLCVAHGGNFERILKRILMGSFKIALWQRIRVTFQNQQAPIDCLNDILVCHSDPASMSRYFLCVGPHGEDQRSSGIWISSAIGSSGAIHSAGGKVLKKDDKKIQYRPRELYYRFYNEYRLTGGIVPSSKTITLTSLMRKGKIYADGAHLRYPLRYNETIHISLSPNPIRTIAV